MREKNKKRGPLDRIVDEDSYGDETESDGNSHDSNLSNHKKKVNSKAR